jgi:mannose-1-phosphate guanylyltransferase/mannose-1-phosphate guanylyltransferase/mannose-6-phosphate isomerase
MTIIPVILSGGAGTRLWPLSRAARPKQLLPLTGERTMLQLTAERTTGEFAPPFVIANAAHAHEIERQLAEIGVAPAALVLEPAARNTAPAIALAAALAPPEALLLVMPSDHLIRDRDAFLAAVRTAEPAARDGWLVTFGITPDRPETGYGYIRAGEAIAPGVLRAERFLEKPDAATAAALVADGQHSWNAGIFLFRADALLAALGDHAPDVLRAVELAIAARGGEGAHVLPGADAFAEAPSISIDYAVMERADRVALVPVSMGWSDIGSWDALHEVGDKDEAANQLAGDAIAIDSANCLIRTDGPAVITVGVQDLIVIATSEAVLVVPRGESQRVKEAVEALKARGGKGL